MCGRYAFDDPKEIFEVRMLLEEIAEIFGEQAASSVKTGEVFPADTAAVLAQNGESARAEPMAWGYPLPGTSRPVINARSETLMEKPMFRGSVMSKKLLIPCTGFYEWQTSGKQKIKYHIRLQDSDFFYLAGLYRAYQFRDLVYNRFVIITSPSAGAMQDIHHRMPLIISKDQKAVWLNAKDNITGIIRTFNDAPAALDIKKADS